MNKKHINLTNVTLILENPEKHLPEFVYKKPQLVKWFFGLINTGKYTEELFVDTSCLSTEYTRKYLESIGFEIKEEENGFSVYDKPHVRVYLVDKTNVVFYFNTNQEMEKWVLDVKLQMAPNLISRS